MKIHNGTKSITKAFSTLLLSMSFVTVFGISAAEAQPGEFKQLSPEQLKQLFTVNERIVTDLEEAFPDAVDPDRTATPPSGDDQPCGDTKTKKKKKKKRGRKKTKRNQAKLAAAARIASLEADGSGCIYACAFSSAWAFVTCHAEACVSCNDGYSYCATASSYAFAYGSAYACSTMCLDGGLPSQCLPPQDPGETYDLGNGYVLSILKGPIPNSPSYATKINDRGDVVGTYGAYDPRSQNAVLWKDGSALDICPGPECGASRPTGINELSQVVGTYYNPGNIQDGFNSFVWSNGTRTTLPRYPGEDGTYDIPNSINNAGLISFINPDYDEFNLQHITGARQSIDLKSMLRSQLDALEAPLLEGPPTGNTEFHIGDVLINNNGLAVGSFYEEVEYRKAISDDLAIELMQSFYGIFRYDGTRAELISPLFGDLLSDNYRPVDLADNGTFIVEDALGHTPMVIRGDQLVRVEEGDIWSKAEARVQGTNNSGIVVGNSAKDRDGIPWSYAGTWQNGSTTDLNSLIPASNPWYLVSASDINSCGEIVGNATTYPNGNQTHGFKLSPKECLR